MKALPRWLSAERLANNELTSLPSPQFIGGIAQAEGNIKNGLAETPSNESRSLHGALHVFEAHYSDLLTSLNQALTNAQATQLPPTPPTGVTLPDAAVHHISDVGLSSDLPGSSAAAVASPEVHTANVALLGQYTASSFVTSAGGFAGTPIPDSPPANLTQVLTHPQHA
jgi:hypothetical protein